LSDCLPKPPSHPKGLPAGQQRQLQMRAFGTGLASGGRMGSNNSDKSDRWLCLCGTRKDIVGADIAG